jgi:RimJ/RimL family protein N-acetyltransferase
MLKGKRVTLRHMQEADLPVFTAYRSNPGSHGEFNQTEGVSPVVSKQRLLETGYSTQSSEVFMICDENSVVIGHVSHFKERAYSTARELGWVIYDEAARGKGYATEAVSLLIDYVFNSFPINRVECVTSPLNLPSTRMAEKVGLTYEGTLRELVFVRGSYHDGAIYSMLRSEWSARKPLSDFT